MAGHQAQTGVDESAGATRKPLPVGDIGPGNVTSWRRSLALFVDLVIYGVGGVVLSYMAIIAHMGFTGDDFDGPPSYDATGDWFLLSLLGLFPLVLSTCEIWLASSPGKRVMGIGIEGRNLLGRWFVKWLPLVVFVVIALVAYGYMEMNRRDYYMQFTLPFHQRMQWMVGRVPAGVGVVVIGISLIRRRVLHDWMAGTTLASRRLRGSKIGGFMPIMPKAGE